MIVIARAAGTVLDSRRSLGMVLQTAAWSLHVTNDSTFAWEESEQSDYLVRLTGNRVQAVV